MKKLLLLFAVIILVGCSNGGVKFTCSYTDSDSQFYYKIEETIEYYTNKVEITDILEFDNEETAKSYYDTYKDSELNSEYKLKGKKVIITTSDKVPENRDFDDIKKEYEEYGYTCK